MKRVLSTFVVLYVLWIAMAGVSLEELIAGAVIALVVSLVIKNLSVYDYSIGIILSVIKFIVLYLPLFLWKLIVANVSLAKIVLNPKLPINPGFVRIKTGLDSDVSKLILANSITLTPGTLSVDVEEDELLIHWVDVKGSTQDDYFKEISKDFEKTLGGIAK